MPLALLILILPGLAWQAWFTGKASRPPYSPASFDYARQRQAASAQDAARHPAPRTPYPAPRTSHPAPIPPFSHSPTPSPTLSLPERLADIIGLSLALGALAGLGGFLLDVQVSGTMLGAFYAALAALTGLPLLRRLRHRPPPTAHRSPPTVHRLLSTLLPLLIFAFIIYWRFEQSRTLALPSWVDSVHHTLVVRLMLEFGGVPQTLDPYIPVPFYYHFGYHLNTALLAFLARVSPAQAVLWGGQVLNAALALAVYRLGMAIWGDWRRASAAMLLLGVVFQMPAYYVTWGRYTLLTGMLLLALAMAAALDIVRLGASRERVARLVALTGGILLTHYFAAVLLALFFVLLLGERTLFGPAQLPGVLTRRRMAGVVLAAGVGGLLALPWVWRVWQFSQASVKMRVITPGQPLDEAYFGNYLNYLWYLLGPKRSHIINGVGLAGLLLAGGRKQPRKGGRIFVRAFGAWAAVFAILSLPWGIHLAPFRPDHGVIAAFLPAALFAADVFISPLDMLGRKWFVVLARVAGAAALAGMLAWGLKETRDIVNPVTVLATEADLPALQWIEENTPPEARFLINTVFWQVQTYRGVDGGWWIMPFTGRQTVLPPALYPQGEPDYLQAVSGLAATMSEIKGCTPEFWELVETARVTHIYLGPDKGSLRPEGLEGCAGVDVIYAEMGVTIYQISPPGP